MSFTPGSKATGGLTAQGMSSKCSIYQNQNSCLITANGDTICGTGELYGQNLILSNAMKVNNTNTMQNTPNSCKYKQPTSSCVFNAEGNEICWPMNQSCNSSLKQKQQVQTMPRSCPSAGASIEHFDMGKTMQEAYNAASRNVQNMYKDGKSYLPSMNEKFYDSTPSSPAPLLFDTSDVVSKDLPEGFENPTKSGLQHMYFPFEKFTEKEMANQSKSASLQNRFNSAYNGIPVLPNANSFLFPSLP